jgi:glycosyltransferase involved in cell wall biosynthesis
MNQDSLENRIHSYSVESEAIWGKAYPLFDRILSSRELKVGVELGVAYAGHSNAILKNTGVSKLYGVDPYLHQDGYDDPMNMAQDEFDCLYQYVLKRMSVHGQRFKLLRMSSIDASQNIDGLLDFIYIDAVHTYDGVKNDLSAWFKKIRDGGVIGGHDYGHDNFPGVQKAIDEFFDRFDWKINTEGEGVWWVEKRPVNISFIMPAYNCEKTVIEAVESIISGNLAKGDELVIVNDASTDQTGAVLGKVKHKYPEIVTITHQHNRGGGAARNTAVMNAKHPLLFCLDSDNILISNSVARLKEFLIISGADAACFEEIRFFQGDGSNVSHKWIFHHSMFDFADHLTGSIVPGASGNYLFTLNSWKRAGGYPEFASAMDTWGFGLRQLATKTVIHVLPNSYYLHRTGIESYWVREARKDNFSTKALQLLLPYWDQFDPEDVKFLVGLLKKDKFEFDLSKHPIRLKNRRAGHTGISTEILAEQQDVSSKSNLLRLYNKVCKRLIRR